MAWISTIFFALFFCGEIFKKTGWNRGEFLRKFYLKTFSEKISPEIPRKNPEKTALCIYVST